MKKKLIIYLCFLTFLVGTLQQKVTAQIQNTKSSSLTLNQAIAFALENNLTAKNASLDIDAAKKQKWEAIAIGLPQISGNINYNHNIKIPSYLAGALSSPQGAFVNFMYAKHIVKPTATLNQVIFDGSYLVGLQSAKVFVDISKNAKIKTDKQITKSVTSAYTNVLLVEKNIKILEKNIKSINGNITETKAMLKNGLVEEEDLEQLQITLNNLKNNLSSSQKMHNISIKLLKLTLGSTSDLDPILTSDLGTLIFETKNQTKTLTNFSVFDNIDYKIAENQVKTKKLLYKLEQAKVLPSITGSLTGGYISANNNSFNFLKKNQSWYGSSSFAVNVNIPIFSSFSSTAKRKRAKIAWKESENDLINTKQQVQIDYETALSDLELAISTLENKNKNLKLSEKVENKNTIKYKEGIASSFDLRQAQMQLYSSQQEYLQAMVNVINKKAELNALKN